MSKSEFDWQSLLHTDAPPGYQLKAGLFTTYDHADECLLAEHVLPLLLKVGREPDGEGKERQYFLLELDHRLKQLHDRLVVVSSTVREEAGEPGDTGNGVYGWLWRSIRHLTVGNRGNAVQHAKLWLLHWASAGAEGSEYLEIVVSSANLTRAAFTGQLQAAWRACLELHAQPSESRRASWGILPEFLRELGVSAGDEQRLAPFKQLLARADCPEGVAIVASVPGVHSRQALRRTPWGVAGLGAISPSGRGGVSMSILCPFVGAWNADTLRDWCATFGGTPDRLELAWIHRDHPWRDHWLLPWSTLETLMQLGATVVRIQHSCENATGIQFHPEHRLQDPRWSHAKAYSLQRGPSRRVLVTSANFSPAAWGRWNSDGSLTIENFELGVSVQQARWPFEDLPPFESHYQIATVTDLPNREQAWILWARAAWDGDAIHIDCRCSSDAAVRGEIESVGESTRLTGWVADAQSGLRSTRVPWTDASRPPVAVRLTSGPESIRIPIFDERPPAERDRTLPPEVDADLACLMRDELLFERYGGRVAEDGDQDNVTIDGVDAAGEDGNGLAGPHYDYSVPAFVLARQHFSVVDAWCDRMKQVMVRGSDGFEKDAILRDGELLVQAFMRQADREDRLDRASAIGAKLAAEELAVRLNHFKEA